LSIPTGIFGRFKGGYITRYFGAPQQGIHAIQLEMCQSTYMDEAYPFSYLPDLAARIQPTVRRMVGGAAAALADLPVPAEHKKRRSDGLSPLPVSGASIYSGLDCG
jgi:hypothetical protein